MDLIGLALLAALVAVGLRAATKWWNQRREDLRREEAGGADPDRPIAVQTYAELEAIVDAAECACGGTLDRIGDTTRNRLHVVRCECLRCEKVTAFYFDLSTLLN